MIVLSKLVVHLQQSVSLEENADLRLQHATFDSS